MKTLTAEQFKKQFGDDAVNSFGETKPTGLQETGQDIMQIGTDIKSSLSTGRTKMNQSMDRAILREQGALETTAQQIGAGLGTASNIFGDIFKGAVKAVLPQSWETGIKSGTTAVITPILETQIAKSVIQKYNSLDERTKANVDAVLGTGSFALDVTGLGIGKKVAQTGIKQGVKGALKTGEIVTELTKSSRKATAKIVKKLASPKPTAIEAVGEVLQGTTKDIKAGVKGLSALNTAGIKTYQQLGDKITKEITNLALKVDKDLAQDTTRTLLKDLTVSGKTSLGKVIKYNPIERAMNQLVELYTKVGDTIGAKNVKEAMTIAKKEGLTKIEINDLARVYGEEFGTKAFSKMGDPLTSVNAQLYENTRKAIKKIARSGIKGKEAQLADETMGNLFRVKTLVNKNIEAVNKLTQKIRERGLLEKIGYNVAKYGDLLSGGTLRGMVGGILPRGVGNKVFNAIDMEKYLESNLKIIQDAIKSGKDADIIKILGKLK